MPKPNILIVHTDQQNADTLSCYGGGIVETPNADRLAREGARFDQFFTNSAVCTPSRGCFVTGRYPHCHGAYVNNLPLNRDEITFAQALKEHGYATGYAGKWHLDGTPRPGWVHPERSMGFDNCRFMFNRGHWKQITEIGMWDVEPQVWNYQVIGDETTYPTDWLTDRCIDFLREERTAPFCYMLSIPDPHHPFSVRSPYDTMFEPAAMPIPPTFDQEDVPSWIETVRESGAYALDNPDRETNLRRHSAQYHGMVKLIDDCLGRLLAELEAQGILDNTIVVFTTDHGDYLGRHGIGNKNHLYEHVYRIPLLMRWPRAIPAGTVIDNIVDTVDFQPTLLALAGVPLGGREQGRDASSLLRGGLTTWNDESFIHHCHFDRAGIFTREWELAFVKDAEGILFDRRNDPEQVDNRFDDPACAAIKRDLGERILSHHQVLDSPAAGWLASLF